VRGVWVATGRGELLHLDGIQRQTWSVPSGPTGIYPENGHVRPTALLVDQDGRVWMGTSESGVWTARPAAQSPGDAPPVLDWRRFTVQDGLASESITALARGPGGRIYAAHRAGISVLGLTGETGAGRWSLLPGSAVDGRGWVDALAFAPAQAGGALWAA
jgi:ligand-binding sensor domain-containing protein